MDQISRRHPGSDPLTKPWPLVPPLLPDEILSSWLCRCALALGTDPIRFTAALWPGSRTWSCDFDRDPGDAQLLSLAASSGLPLTDIERAALGGWARSWMGDAPSPQGGWPWLIPIGVRGIARTGITQFCPLCWRADGEPHYRRLWRLSWYVVCERHGTLLHDRCPSCSSALAPHRLQLGAASLGRCDRCGSDLSAAPAGAQAPASFLTFQATAVSALMRGEASWWEWPLNTTRWFATLRFWLVLLRQGLREGPSPAATLARNVAPDLHRVPAKGRFDALPSEARATLLAAVATLAELDRGAALRLAQRSGLTQQHSSPWMQRVEDAKAWAFRLPDGTVQRKPRATERRRCRYGLGHPRPPHEVERIYQRLLRGAGVAQ